MKAEPYLCLGGVELGNALRTLTYLRRGLGGSRWEVHVANHDVGGCVIVTTYPDDTIDDVFADVFGGTAETSTVCDEFWPGNLGCYCADYDEGPYLSPEEDGAPWYSPDEPASADFLGFIPERVEVEPSLSRAVDEFSRGAALGPQQAGGQRVAVSGLLFAASSDGMDYGTAWLRSQLAGALLDRDRTLRFLPACPSDGRDAAWRNLASVGLIDKPTIQPVQDGVPECVVSSAAFQLLSELPYLLTDTTALLDATVDDTTPQLVLASFASELGDAALRFTIDAIVDAEIKVEAFPTSGGTCPSYAPSPAWSWTATVGGGERMSVDGVAGVADLINPATLETLAGLDALDYDAPFVWPVLLPCTELCLRISATAGVADVLVEQVGRRL